MYFLSGALVALFVQRSVTIYAILVDGITRNNSVILLRIWVSGSDVI